MWAPGYGRPGREGEGQEQGSDRPAGHWVRCSAVQQVVASDRQATVHHSSAHRAASRRAIPRDSF